MVAGAKEAGGAAGNGRGGVSPAPPPIDGEGPPQATQARKPRILGLDAFRGITMAVMLLVDEVGAAYPSIGHSPWDAVHLADFVMPFFLFISGAGMSVALRMRPGASRRRAFLALVPRALRLFLVGILMQGPFFHLGQGVSSIGLDLRTVRIMGILQRIAFAYVVVGAIELFVPTWPGSSEPAASGMQLLRMTALRWLASGCFLVVGSILSCGWQPPASWPGCAEHVYVSDGHRYVAATGGDVTDNAQLKEMGCSAVGWLDSHILGVDHMYITGSSAYGSTGANFGFDPEGLTASLATVFTMYVGLHVGQVWVQTQRPGVCLPYWFGLGAAFLLLGWALDAWCVPFNKRLWSPSYNFLMCGAATWLYAAFFAVCDAAAAAAARGDAQSARAPVAARWGQACCAPLIWLGTNAILFFCLSNSCSVLKWLLQSVSWGAPRADNNLPAWFEKTVLWSWARLGQSCAGGLHGPVSDRDPMACGPVILASVVVQLAFWTAVCGILYRKKIFWKV